MKQLYVTALLSLITVVSGIAQPTVTSISPIRHAIDQNTNTDITITFSDTNMDASTINSSTFIVKGSYGNIYDGTYSVTNGVATFTPTQDFRSGEEISVILTTGIENASNVALNKGYYYSFETVNENEEKFKTPVDYTVKGAGNYANYTAVADLDEDGFLDLVISTPLQDVLTVYINNGDGTYGAGTDISTNQSVFEFSTVDVDNDGDVDIVTANNSVNSLSVFLNNGGGTGTFAARTDYATLNQSPGKSQVAADLNMDGYIDIVQSNFSTDSLHVFINDGAGAFNALVGVATNNRVGSLTAVDFDSDYIVDLVVSEGDSDQIITYKNDGAGNLSLNTIIAVGDGPVSIAAANIDASSGTMDAYVINSFDNTIYSLYDGAGSAFSNSSTTTTGTSPIWVTALDVNSDGYQDAVVSNYDQTLSILLNDGAGNLTSSSFSMNSTYGNHITKADVDNDGDLDLITANQNGTFSIIEAYEGPQVVSSTPLNTSFNQLANTSITIKFDDLMDSATLNENGIKVLGSLRGQYSATYTFSVLDSTVTIVPDSTFKKGEIIQVNVNENVESSSGASLQETYTYAFSIETGSGGGYGIGAAFSAGSGAKDIAVIDLNNDGFEDVVTANSTADSISVLLGVGDGTFGAATHYYAGTGVNSIDVGDVDGDGNLDILAGINDTSMSLFLGTGTGSFAAKVARGTFGYADKLTLADLDSDGDLDLLYSNNVGTYRETNDGTGTFTLHRTVHTGKTNIDVADFDNDGSLDAVSVQNNGGISKLIVAFDIGANTITNAEYSVNEVTGTVRAGDFNGDGYADVVGSASGKIFYYPNNGDGSLGTKVSVTLSETGIAEDFRVVDYDNDGDLDVIVAATDHDKLILVSNDGNGVFSENRVIAAGDAPSAIALADVNRDGIVDLLSADYNTGQISVHSGGLIPTIVSLTPDAYSLSADTTANIEITFNTALDASTVTTSNITAYSAKKGAVAGAVSYNSGTNTISFDPTNTLEAGEEIFVSISSAITSDKGLALDSDEEYSFRVKNYASDIYLSEATYSTVGSIKQKTMATADMNGDGHIDVIGVINWPYAISISFNDGMGGFASNDTTTLTNNSAHYLDVADFDQDGDFDVLIAKNVMGSTEITTYLNDGLGNLSLLETKILSGTAFVNPTIGDINGDGYADVLTVDNATSNLYKFTNDLDGTFTESMVSSAVGTGSHSILLVDVDDDNDLDLVSSDYGDNTISVLKNDGLGTFAARVTYAVNSTLPGSLVAGDVNGDGTLDLVLFSNDEEAFDVMLNQGSGVFSYSNSVIVSGRSISLTDIDGDEDLDVLVRKSQSINAYPNNGTGIFSTYEEIGFGTYINDFDLLDVDGDGALDLVIVGNDISTALNKPKVEVVSATPARNALGVGVSDDITITFSKDIATATLNSNNVHVKSTTSGVIDASYTFNAGTKTLTINPTTDFRVGEELTISVTTNVTNTDGVNLYRPFMSSFTTAASGFGTLVYRDSTSVSTFASLNKLLGADVDNDGDIDLISNNGASIEVFKNTGGVYSHFSSLAVTYPERILLDDIDGDGYVDIFSKPNGDNHILSNDGTGVFTGADTMSTVTSTWYDHILADINSDGYPDILHLTGSQLLYYKFGAGDFSFPTSGYSTMEHESSETRFNSNHIAAGDIDNDGDIDILATEKGQSKLLVMTNSQGSFTGTGMYEVGSNPEEIRIADFNGDGYNDVLIIREDSDAFTVLVNNGDGTFGAANDYGLDANAYMNDVYVKDIDGDNDIDIVLYYEHDLTGGQEILLAYNNGSGVFGNQNLFKYPNGSPYSYGSFPNELVFADIDGDADLDIITHAADYNAAGNRVLLTTLNEEVIATTPTLAASNISASSTATSSVISWTNGDGNRRLVVVKEGSPVNATPADSANYNPNAIFGNGTEIGTGNFVIYAGTANTAAVTGLQSETEYYVEIFEMNGLPGAEKLLTASTAVGSFTTAPPPTIWSKNDSTLTFTKADNAEPTEASNQDRITDIVWFTRAASRGLYNAALEYEYESYNSPEGTLWALGTTDNLSTLTFDSFENTLDGSIGDNIVGTDMVVYVEDENLYFDINFSSWTSGGSGGGFSYTRAKGPASRTEEFVFDTNAGSAITFDGGSSNAEYVEFDSGVLTSNFTTEFWVNPSALDANQVILSHRRDNFIIGLNASNQFYATHEQPEAGSSGGGGGGGEEEPDGPPIFVAPSVDDNLSSNRQAFSTGSSIITATSTTTATTDSWYHVAIAAQSNEYMVLYINGVAEDSVATSILYVDENSWKLGTDHDRITDFSGTVDEFRIWKTKRAESQIRSFMHRTYEGKKDHLVGYWQFNDGSGSVAADATGNFDGSINNSNGWTISGAPVGQGTIEEVEDFQTGSTTVGKTTLSMADGFDNPVDIQVTEVSGDPNTFPAGITSTIGGTYFVINLYGDPGTFSADLTLNYGAGAISPEQAAMPSQIKLFKRSSNSSGSWTDLGGASSANASTGEVTWTGITSFSQFMSVYKEFDLIQTPDTTLLSFNDSTLTMPGSFFNFEANYVDSTMSITLDENASGTLFIDNNADNVFNSGDVSITSAQTETYLPSTGSLKYASSLLNADSLTIRLTAGQFSDSIKVTVATFKANPQLHHTSGQDGWFMLSNPLDVPISSWLGDLWTQGAVNSDAPGAGATLYTFNQDSAYFEPITTDLDTTKLAAGQGLLAYLFADDDFLDGNAPANGGWPKVLENYGNPFTTDDITVTIKNNDKDNSGTTNGDEGWALMGNPYGWNISVDSLLNTIQRSDASASNFIYRWDTQNGEYVVAGSGSIAPYESFFVRLVTSGVTANVQFGYDDHVVDAGIKAVNQQAEIPTLAFTLSGDGTDKVSKSSIRIMDEAQVGADRNDAYYLQPLSAQYSNLYSKVDDLNMVINTVPSTLGEVIEIPFYLNTNVGGTFDLSWEGSELPDDWKITVIDMQTLQEYDVRSQEVIQLNRNVKASVASERNVLAKANTSGSEPVYLVRMEPSTSVSNEELVEIPETVELRQNYPNPFNPSTAIQFGVPQAGKVKLEVYDVLGRKVATLLNNEFTSAGRHTVTFNARDLASGMYIYRLEVNGKALIQKMTLIK